MDVFLMNEFWTNIFPNYDVLMCKHYCKNVLIPLSLTCKNLNKIYGQKLNKVCDCSSCNYKKKFKHLCRTSIRCSCYICQFRLKKCKECIKNNTLKCTNCICKRCSMSSNLVGKLLYGSCKICNSYSYRLKPETYQPSGTCNYSRTDDPPTIQLNFIT
jgi:hypothetical protein